MGKLTILFGGILIALALYGYFGSDPTHRSPTAFIPAAVGLPLVICGALALKENYRKHAMHAAAAFGLLGALAAGGRGLPKIGLLFNSEAEGNRRAVVMVLLMFVVCAVFVGLCVQSFIQARKRQAAAGE